MLKSFAFNCIKSFSWLYLWAGHKGHGSLPDCALLMEYSDSVVKQYVPIYLVIKLFFHAGQSDTWKVNIKGILFSH